MERVYKTMRNTGAANIAVGVVSEYAAQLWICFPYLGCLVCPYRERMFLVLV